MWAKKVCALRWAGRRIGMAGRPEAKGGGRRPKRTIASAAEVGRFRPGRDEIIVCTALDLKASGLQFWGLNVAGLRPSGLAAVRPAR
ncbi:MAG: hypothetical protein F4092_11550 [Rhodospirillaceae bacterium]|nr:hypothetical protein [Rhodospirillaceae bacterium]